MIEEGLEQGTPLDRATISYYVVSLAEKLGRPVDVVTTAGASPRFLGKIRKDEVVLYEAS